MDTDDLTACAFAEAVVFPKVFNDLPDPRQRGEVRYPLGEILLLCLLAVLAGVDCIADIARFGQKKRDLLRRFRPFADGTPSHDHRGDILASLDAAAFQTCFVAWTASITGVDPDVIAIDGKTSRRSYQTKGGSDPIHMVDWLDNHGWPGLKSIIVVDAQREVDGKIQTETRLYITSLVLFAHVVGPLVRAHWAVENGLH